MKRTLFTLALVAAFGLITESAFAQATATQSVTLAVNAVYKISTSGNPGAPGGQYGV